MVMRPLTMSSIRPTAKYWNNSSDFSPYEILAFIAMYFSYELFRLLEALKWFQTNSILNSTNHMHDSE